MPTSSSIIQEQFPSENDSTLRKEYCVQLNGGNCLNGAEYRERSYIILAQQPLTVHKHFKLWYDN